MALTVGDLRRILGPGGTLAALPDSAPVAMHGYDDALLRVEHIDARRASECSGSLHALAPLEKPTHPQARVRKVLLFW